MQSSSRQPPSGPRAARLLAGVLAAACLCIAAPAPPAWADGPPACDDASDHSRTLILPPGGAIGRTRGAPPLLAHGEIALTFDDGPDPDVTPLILDALAAACVRAVFFVVGEKAREEPELLARIIAEGHVVGAHGETNANLTRMSHAEAVRDIERGLEPLHAAGLKPGLFRFPNLEATDGLESWLSERGFALVGIDLDSRDWSGDPPNETIARVTGELDDRGGGVLLLHDNQPATAELLPDLLALLQRRGVGFVLLRGGRGEVRVSGR